MINFEMKDNFIRKIILPPGPILSMTLIGLLLLSALLYYRSVKIQRFLEPALAISEPRMKFNQDITTLLTKEFEAAATRITYKSGSIYVDQSLLFPTAHGLETPDPSAFNKLGRVFYSALSNLNIRSHVSLILVSIHYPVTKDIKLNRKLRYQVQERAALILNLLYGAAPALEEKFGEYFAVTALPVSTLREKSGWVEFRMVPTERLHIDVIERLEKYSY